MRISDCSSDVFSSDLFASVHLHQQAVAARPGAVKLYLHEFAETDPVKWSTGSSLLAFTGNVRAEDFVTVEAVDFAAFLAAMARPVALLKLDIEGAEAADLERRLARCLHNRIERAFVEEIGRLSVREIGV